MIGSRNCWHSRKKSSEAEPRESEKGWYSSPALQKVPTDAARFSSAPVVLLSPSQCSRLSRISHVFIRRCFVVIWQNIAFAPGSVFMRSAGRNLDLLRSEKRNRTSTMSNLCNLIGDKRTQLHPHLRASSLQEAAHPLRRAVRD